MDYSMTDLKKFSANQNVYFEYWIPIKHPDLDSSTFNLPIKTGDFATRSDVMI
jgi:hypothetical protein